MSDNRDGYIPAPSRGLLRKENLPCGIILLGVIGAVIWIYLHVARFGFVYDDFDYIVQNYNIQKGLNLNSLGWAFLNTYASNWHPLTWLAHTAAFDLFGMKPAGHHLVNLFLHIANTVLLFGLLCKMTGARYKSAFVAALFAVHPLRVESVAWISELKDVLSAFFGFLTLWAYLCYVAKPSVKRYLPVIFLLALSLMAKPMLVTLPFLFILLDYWPLDRSPFPAGNGTSMGNGVTGSLPLARLLGEKIPLFLLVGISSMVTMAAQTVSIKELPLGYRLVNAVVSYVGYIQHTVWPSGLAALYPYPVTLSYSAFGFSLCLLAAISVFVLYSGKRFPFLVTGWFWYLGMLVPVIGLVQVGLQAMADRYTYLASIGLFIMIVWGLSAALENHPRAKRVFVAGGCATLILLAILARAQTMYWQDQLTVFTRALDVTEDNYVAHNNVGYELRAEHKTDMAIAHFNAALSINPVYCDALNNLGKALQDQGKFDEAIARFDAALNVKPDDCDTLSNLGNAFQARGKLDEAATYYRKALSIDPHYYQAHNNLGTVLAIQGNLDEAVAHFNAALSLRPDYYDALKNLGTALQSQGKLDEAIARFHQALSIKPDDIGVLNNLGSAFEARGKLDEAVTYYKAALDLDPTLAIVRQNLEHALHAR